MSQEYLEGNSIILKYYFISLIIYIIKEELENPFEDNQIYRLHTLYEESELNLLTIKKFM